MEELTTTSAVIDKLDGNRPVSKIVGVLPSAVSNWRKWEKFPAHTHAPLIDALERRGCTAPRSLWRWEAPRYKRATQ